jgi:DNA-binding beta-propeller fold protein YncE
VQTKVIGGGVVSYPTSVALDSHNNIYVSNLGDFTVDVFKPNGTQDKTKTMNNANNGIQSPVGIVIDGMDNLWVNNNGNHINIYAPDKTLLNTYTPTDYVSVIGLRGAVFVEAHTTEIDNLVSGKVLTNKSFGHAGLPGKMAEALAVDNTGKVYFGTVTGEIGVYDTVANAAYDIAVVPYGPSGMAVDKANNRLYVASDDLNKIDVFSLTGTYLTTLH